MATEEALRSTLGAKGTHFTGEGFGTKDRHPFSRGKFWDQGSKPSGTPKPKIHRDPFSRRKFWDPFFPGPCDTQATRNKARTCRYEPHHGAAVERLREGVHKVACEALCGPRRGYGGQPNSADPKPETRTKTRTRDPSPPRPTYTCHGVGGGRRGDEGRVILSLTVSANR